MAFRIPAIPDSWMTGFLDVYDLHAALLHILDHYKIGKVKLRKRMGYSKQLVEDALSGTNRSATLLVFIQVCKEINHPVIFAVYGRQPIRKVLPWQKSHARKKLRISHSK